MFRTKVCRIFTFIAFCTFIQSLTVLYYKVSNNKGWFNQGCPEKQRRDFFRSGLSINGNGEVVPEFTGNTDCYRINTSASGVNRFVPKDISFDNECKNVVKRFMTENETTYKTALASLPGSGNTWVRHLLEEVTGIYTGSIYNSSWIRDVFKGENTTDHVIVVKIHRSATKLMPGRFGRAVLVIRDPFDTALSEFNRENTLSKTGIVREEEFSKTSFVGSLNTTVISWRNFYVNWLKLFPGPVFVVFYDKLISDLKNSLAKLCLFLETPITVKDLWCAELRQEGLYHRPEKPGYMTRSKLVDSELEILIENARKQIVDMCLDSNNKNRIKSNL